jgi:hypothetical protein
MLFEALFAPFALGDVSHDAGVAVVLTVVWREQGGVDLGRVVSAVFRVDLDLDRLGVVVGPQQVTDDRFDALVTLLGDDQRPVLSDAFAGVVARLCLEGFVDVDEVAGLVDGVDWVAQRLDDGFEAFEFLRSLFAGGHVTHHADQAGVGVVGTGQQLDVQ